MLLSVQKTPLLKAKLNLTDTSFEQLGASMPALWPETANDWAGRQETCSLFFLFPPEPLTVTICTSSWHFTQFALCICCFFTLTLVFDYFKCTKLVQKRTQRTITSVMPLLLSGTQVLWGYRSAFFFFFFFFLLDTWIFPLKNKR